MAKSNTELQTRYGKWTKDTSATNKADGLVELNDEHRLILGSKPWPFMEDSQDIATVASQQKYDFPGNAGKIKAIKVKNGSTDYRPKRCKSFQQWIDINQSTNFTSDIPEWWFTIGRKILLWPKPSAGGNTMTVFYRKRVRDLSVADYTTGTITTTVNGDETIVGTGTSWTAGMADKWIRITHTNAANVGDGIWYEIDSITDGTNLELKAPYEGAAITAGSAAYTLADMPQLPEDFHQIILYRPVAKYWFENEDADLANSYLDRFKEEYAVMTEQWLNYQDDFVLDDGKDDTIINPNLTISL